MTEQEYLQYRLTSSTLMLTRYFFKKRFGRKFILGEHHRKICDVLDRILRGELTRVIINMPPRYSKTELCVKNFIAAGLAINPAAKFIHLSGSDDLALDNSEEVRDLVRDPEYTSVFPYVQIKKDSDAKKKWYTVAGGGVYATSAAGQVTGFGAGAVDEETLKGEIDTLVNRSDITKFAGAIIIDDPIKPEDANSGTVRDRVNNRFDSTIRSRTNSRNTPIMIVMQRLHPEDLCGYLLEKEGNAQDGGEWFVLSLPALSVDENGNEMALWEFKQTIEELKKLRKANECVFDSQYQQDPSPREGILFPKQELQFEDFSKLDFSQCEYSILQVDPADKGNDFGAALGKLLDGKIYIDQITCNSTGLDYNIPAVIQTGVARKPSIVNLEGNGGWIQTCKDIRKGIQDADDSIEVLIYPETKNKEEKISGQAYFIKTRFVFRKDYQSNPEYEMAIKKLTRYLRNVKNQPDDIPDLLSSMSRYIRRNVLTE